MVTTRYVVFKKILEEFGKGCYAITIGPGMDNLYIVNLGMQWYLVLYNGAHGIIASLVGSRA